MSPRLLKSHGPTGNTGSAFQRGDGFDDAEKRQIDAFLAQETLPPVEHRDPDDVDRYCEQSRCARWVRGRGVTVKVPGLDPSARVKEEA